MARRGKKKILLVMGNERGELFEHPYLEAVGQEDTEWAVIKPERMITIPEGSQLFFMPNTKPVGYNRRKKCFETVDLFYGEEVRAAASFVVQGYTRTYLPSYEFREEPKEELPLWAWAAVGWDGENFVVPAFRADEDTRMDPCNYDDSNLPQLVEKRLEVDPENPILRQLKTCALEYNCLASKNVFHERWECPVPVSNSCNAKCVGCISEQEEDSTIESPQERIRYIPTPEDIYKVASYHFDRVESGFISFGQGCEGDPLLRAKVIAPALERLEKEYPKAGLNMNTNGGLTKNVIQLVDSGLTSIRISLNSARETFYEAYFRPMGYGFQDVVNSIKYAASHGVYTAINYLILPGVNDRMEEIEPLIRLIEETGLHQVQLRNLNIDPVMYLPKLPPRSGEILGLDKLRDILREKFPNLDLGYYNRAKPDYKGYSKEEFKIL